MENRKMMNKKADFTIPVLVILTLVLTGGALFIFNINTAEANQEIIDTQIFDTLYFKENEINFIVNEILENSLKEGRENLIDNFKTQLEAYKGEDGNYSIEELSQVENQAENMIISETEVIFDMKIKIETKTEGIDVAYLYGKRFKKDL